LFPIFPIIGLVATRTSSCDASRRDPDHDQHRHIILLLHFFLFSLLLLESHRNTKIVTDYPPNSAVWHSLCVTGTHQW
jgi:hypothetical protein